MTIYTTEQKFSHLKKWVTSGQLLKDYCNEEGVSESAMHRWALNILGSNYTTTFKNTQQKDVLLKKINELESPSKMGSIRKAQSNTLVMINRSKHKDSVIAAPISIEYMGARISIDENSIESVFRALRAVNG